MSFTGSPPSRRSVEDDRSGTGPPLLLVILSACPPHVILEVRRTDGIQEWARTDGRQNLATCCLSAHGPRMGEDPGIVILATIPPSEIISMSFTGSPPSRRSVEDDGSGTGSPLLRVAQSRMTEVGQAPLLRVAQSRMTEVGQDPLLRVAQSRMTKVGHLCDCPDN